MLSNYIALSNRLVTCPAPHADACGTRALPPSRSLVRAHAARPSARAQALVAPAAQAWGRWVCNCCSVLLTRAWRQPEAAGALPRGHQAPRCTCRLMRGRSNKPPPDGSKRSPRRRALCSSPLRLTAPPVPQHVCVSMCGCACAAAQPAPSECRIVRCPPRHELCADNIAAQPPTPRAHMPVAVRPVQRVVPGVGAAAGSVCEGRPGSPPTGLRDPSGAPGACQGGVQAAGGSRQQRQQGALAAARTAPQQHTLHEAA